ncbi:hypothetical protein Hs30E_20610 [Lactococcus hodotermopsidis]|uniref:Uncharacterized protein n=1 Tax=Pseudolactococcus hodotermopsidis TaxID=2709157 RepID=A0A6A0BDM6_9LACT|nr:hypothetical protein Hs30E_20610 [Lactococcus hodotermopsidis]
MTDEWDKSGVKRGQEYVTLTDLMTETWSGLKTRDYKKYKGLKKENLRDNMTILNSLKIKNTFNSLTIGISQNSLLDCFIIGHTYSISYVSLFYRIEYIKEGTR